MGVPRSERLLLVLLACSTGVLTAPAAAGGKGGKIDGTATARASITKVHLVQSNHLDVGFTGSITTVLNDYFDKYLPSAVNTSAALRERGGEEQLVFTTHAYVLSLFLDCPPGRGLHCPMPAAISDVEASLRDGSIAVSTASNLHGPARPGCSLFWEYTLKKSVLKKA